MAVIRTRILVPPLSPRERHQKLLDGARVDGCSLFASPSTASEIGLMASRPSLVTPSGRFDVARQQVSLSEDAKVEIVSIRTPKIDKKVVK